MIENLNLQSQTHLQIRQTFEIGELLGFETRNKYQIIDENGQYIGFVAEQQKGFLGFIFRQFLGHWRTFEIHFFDQNRSPIMVGRHPFRWFFQQLDLLQTNGRYLGRIVRRFSLLSKSFEVQDSRGRILFEVSSPFWRIWTFPFMRGPSEMARVSKKWSGLGFEVITDKDNFHLEFLNPVLSVEERALILASSIYIDLLYFENKGRGLV
ncbi:MAG: phospholipid scramblase-related protein [Pseudobdellovibrionaceae bacterium]